MRTPGFEQWQLYLVDWGYNTPAERERAANSGRIRVIGVREFADIMRHGADGAGL